MITRTYFATRAFATGPSRASAHGWETGSLERSLIVARKVSPAQTDFSQPMRENTLAQNAVGTIQPLALKHCAPVAELVDARDSKSRFFGSARSSRAGGTNSQFCFHHQAANRAYQARAFLALNILLATGDFSFMRQRRFFAKCNNCLRPSIELGSEGRVTEIVLFLRRYGESVWFPYQFTSLNFCGLGSTGALWEGGVLTTVRFGRIYL